MKITLASLLGLLLILSGCAAHQQVRLPELPGTAGDGRRIPACTAIFPQGKWEFVHSIEFTMQDGAGPPIIGVTTIDGNTIGCALITVEGLTLFDAVYTVKAGKDSVEVRRAVPPFDKPDFARGMIGDIRAMFRPPTAGEVQTGLSAGGNSVCRYKEASGGVVDIELTADNCWQIKGYNAELLLQRTITSRLCRKKAFNLIPDYLDLETYGRNGYTLKMTLIRADSIP